MYNIIHVHCTCVFPVRCMCMCVQVRSQHMHAHTNSSSWHSLFLPAALCTPWPSRLPHLPLTIETRNYVFPGQTVKHMGASKVILKVRSHYSHKMEWGIVVYLLHVQGTVCQGRHYRMRFVIAQSYYP